MGILCNCLVGAFTGGGFSTGAMPLGLRVRADKKRASGQEEPTSPAPTHVLCSGDVYMMPSSLTGVVRTRSEHLQVSGPGFQERIARGGVFDVAERP